VSVTSADTAVISRQGRREAMEDTYVLEVESRDPLRVLGAVFDGHGGDEVALLAQRRFPALFREHGASGVEAALRAAFAAIHHEAKGLPGGAVAAAFWLEEKRVTVANVGDAHVVTVGLEGTHQLTADHRITNPAERERVLAAGAVIDGPYAMHPRLDEGLEPTRTLGDHKLGEVGILAEPAVSTSLLSPGFLIAASDGLWDWVDPSGVPGLIAGATAANEVVDLLYREAFENRGSEDNITLVVVHVP